MCTKICYKRLFLIKKQFLHYLLENKLNVYAVYCIYNSIIFIKYKEGGKLRLSWHKEI